MTEWGNIWEYLQNNEIRVSIASEKIDTASKWMMFMGGQILHNARLRWLYPELQLIDIGYTRANRWSSLYLDLPHLGIYPEPTFSVTGIRGAQQGGHYDILDADDIVGEKGAESAVVLEDALRWFDNVEELLVQPDMGMPNPSRIKLKGTHWGPGDWAICLMGFYPEYKWHVVSCQKDSSLVNQDNITYINNPDVGELESNWPEVFSTKHYIDMAANPEKRMVYWAQHRNSPRGTDNPLTKFDISWLRYYRFDNRQGETGPELWIVCEDDKEEFRVEDIPLYGMIDPGGFSELKLVKTGSRNAMLVGGQPRESIKKFVFDTDAGRFKDPKTFMDKLFDMDARWKPRRWEIESHTGAQGYIYKDIKQEGKNRGRRLLIIELEADR
ncbi:hypothetical protein, partial [Candidatus Magnetobacterium casense]